MLSRRVFFSALVAGFALVASIAPAKAEPAEASAFIEKLADTAMNSVAAPGLSQDERNERFRTLFVNTFDLPEIGKLVLGRYWRLATPEERQEFLKLFEEVQVLTWARRFSDYSGEKLEVLGVIADGQTDYTVDSLIRRPNLDPIAVQWLVRKNGDEYRVLDIKVQSSSMALTHRSQYTTVIQNSGGKVAGLLRALQGQLERMRADLASR